MRDRNWWTQKGREVGRRAEVDETVIRMHYVRGKNLLSIKENFILLKKYDIKE